MSRSFVLDTPYDIHISIAKSYDGCSGLYTCIVGLVSPLLQSNISFFLWTFYKDVKEFDEEQ